MDCSTPGFPVLHHLLEFSQTHLDSVSDSIQQFHPLPPPFPLAFNLFSFRVFSNESALTLGGQSIGVSVSASVLPLNTQGWFPLGLTGLIISLQSKGLWRIFSSTTVWKHQFFGAQPSLGSNSHIIHDYWKNRIYDYMDLCRQSDVSAFENTV